MRSAHPTELRVTAAVDISKVGDGFAIKSREHSIR